MLVDLFYSGTGGVYSIPLYRLRHLTTLTVIYVNGNLNYSLTKQVEQ
jgi:hypothetical protein